MHNSDVCLHHMAELVVVVVVVLLKEENNRNVVVVAVVRNYECAGDGGGRTIEIQLEILTIEILNWQTLEKRKEFLSLVQCYMIDSLPFSDFFELTKCNRTRANHDCKLYVIVAILNCYKYSFFIQIVSAWNNLPKDVVHAGSLTLIRSRLRIYMNIEHVIF